MKARLVALTDLGQRDLERWHSLANRAVEPNAFLDPRFLVPFGRPPAGDPGTQLLFVEDSQDLRAVMCVHLTKRRIGGLAFPIASSASPFLANWTPRHYPLVDAEHPVVAWEGLLRGLKTAGLPGLVDLEGFPADTELGATLFTAGARAKVPIVERGSQDFAFRYRTERDVSFAQNGPSPPRVARLKLDQLSASSGKRYLQHLRAFERHAGGSLVLVDRGRDPAALEEFLDLQAAGWKGNAERGGNAMRTVGSDVWFAEAAAAFRAE